MTDPSAKSARLETACRALVKSYNSVHGLDLSGEDIARLIDNSILKANTLITYGVDDGPAHVAAEAVSQVIREEYGLDDDDLGKRRHS